MAIPTFTKSGTKSTTSAKLDKSVFEVEVANHRLLKDAYHAYLDNGRQNLAVTKTRGLVRGGGRKPWKQKGTGRARFGSSRVPIWRGGGITFGPTGNENYSKKLNQKAKRTAIRQALTLAAQANKLCIIEAFEIQDGKVKSTQELLNKINAKGRVLIVVENKTEEIKRATNNLEAVTLVQAKYLNTFDVLNADTIVVTKNSLSIISDWLGGEK